jgi:FdhE protein
VRLLDLALAAAEEPAWEAAVPRPAPTHPGGERPYDAPLLHGAVARVDARRLRRLVRDLEREAAAAAAAAGEGAPARAPERARGRRLDVVALLRGAIAHDAATLARVAKAARIPEPTLGAIAQLAAIPLLHACGRSLRDQAPRTWSKGYCPVCGAWPTLAELRGLDRGRRLRCGRCAADWAFDVLRCPFCDEARHDRLGALLPEGEEQTRRVDACRSCHGYIKTFATLQPLPPRALALRDLGSVELDLVAREHGYARPEGLGYPLAITVERSAGGAAPRRAVAGELQ